MTLRIGLILLLLLSVPFWAGGCGPGAPADTLTVHAAASLADVVADLAAGWEQRTGERIRVSLAASSTLARQIARGAPADLFLSADPRWLEDLEFLERDDWLVNRLAWVVSVPPGGIGGAPAGGMPEARPEQVVRWCAETSALALGADGVPVGRYADQALARLAAPRPPRIVRGAHARDVLAKVASGATDAGIVYATDATLDPRVRPVALLPVDVHDPIVYVAIALTERARPLLQALHAPWMVELATARGFGVAP